MTTDRHVLTRIALPCLVLGLALGIVALSSACSDDAGSFSLDAGADARPDGDAGGATRTLVMVHAASFPAVRVCFSDTVDEPPLPSSELMPSSNLVGLDTGTAVRVEARAAPRGRVFLFPERRIRPYYPAGETGLPCRKLLELEAAIEIGSIAAELPAGASLLVFSGCPPLAEDESAGTARCGESWSAASGNLAVSVVALETFPRTNRAVLPVQVMLLSPALSSAAGDRPLGFGIGDLDAQAPAPLVSGAFPLGVAVPEEPVFLPFDPELSANFATRALFVVALEATGPRTLFVQSLADVQRASAPTSIPLTWYAGASNYVVLVLGDPEPPQVDGGVDPRRALHFVALPLAP